MLSRVFRSDDAELRFDFLPHDMPHYRGLFLPLYSEVRCCAGNTQCFHGARQVKLDEDPGNSDKTAFSRDVFDT